MPKFGKQPRPRQQVHGPLLGQVEDHSLAARAVAHEGDDTVRTDIGGSHGAVGAIDHETHVVIVHEACVMVCATQCGGAPELGRLTVVRAE